MGTCLTRSKSARFWPHSTKTRFRKASSWPKLICITAKQSLEDLKDTQVAIANAQLVVVQAQDALEDAERARDRISPDRRMMSQLTIDTAKADLPHCAGRL